MEVYGEGFENYLEALFKPGGVFSSDRVKQGLEVLRFVRNIMPEGLKDRINEMPNVLYENVPPPKVTIIKIIKMMYTHSHLHIFMCRNVFILNQSLFKCCIFEFFFFQLSLAIKVFGNEIKFLRLNGVDEINEVIRSFDVYNIMQSFMNGRVRISLIRFTIIIFMVC